MLFPLAYSTRVAVVTCVLFALTYLMGVGAHLKAKFETKSSPHIRVIINGFNLLDTLSTCSSPVQLHGQQRNNLVQINQSKALVEMK